MCAAKIGVLDSGLGGLTVLREIHRLLPGCPTLYVADQGHLPYGPRPAEEIHTYVENITRFLIDQGAVMIVLACHSASAASLQKLRLAYPAIPFVGIEPAIKPAAEATQTGVIGVLTTQATADGSLYRSVLERYAGHVRVMTQITPELVTLVENGDWDTPQGEAVIRRYVDPVCAAGADHLVLACTHFPFLAPAIQRIVGTQLTLVDPGPAVARQVARVYPVDLTPTPHINHYFTTGSADAFQSMHKKLTGTDAPVSHIDLP